MASQVKWIANAVSISGLEMPKDSDPSEFVYFQVYVCGFLFIPILTSKLSF